MPETITDTQQFIISFQLKADSPAFDPTALARAIQTSLADGTITLSGIGIDLNTIEVKPRECTCLKHILTTRQPTS